MGVVLHLKFFPAGLPDYDWHASLKINFDCAPHLSAGGIGKHVLQLFQQFWIHFAPLLS
jgi:hypothetical protein